MNASVSSSFDANWLLYDGECPFCRNYIQLLRLKKQLDLQLLDGRTHQDLVQVLKLRSININDGMILNLNGQIYHGKDAMVVLTQLDSDNQLLQKFMKIFFLNQKRASIFYPFCVFVRNTALALMRKDQI